MTDSSTVAAAIDCGSHSTRLLIASEDEVILRRMEITRMAEGLTASGRLSDAAIERTLATLASFRDDIQEAGATRVRLTATAAARRAENSLRFVEAAQAVVGVDVEVLSGEEEARLSVAGATHRLDPDAGPYLVVDIGGGSTEVAVGRRGEYLGGVSIDIGCVWASETFLHSDPPAPEELSALLSVVGLHWTDVQRDLPAVSMATGLVGLAGTVATVAQVEIGTDDHSAVDGFTLSKAAVEDVFRTLATEAAVDRAANPGLPAGRVDTIVGGVAILASLMRSFDVGELRCSEADILDGLVLSMLDPAGHTATGQR